MPNRSLVAVLASVLVAAGLGLSGCSGSPSPGSPAGPRTGPGPAAAATSDDLALRAVLLSLVDQQLFEPVIVRRGLVGPPAVRRATAEAVGRIGDPDGLPSLYALLVDDDVEVRREAAFALGEVLEAPELASPEGEAPEAKVRAAARLLDALDDPDREVGRLAVEALGKGGVSVTTVAGRLAAPAEEGAPPAVSEEERRARLLPALFRYPEPQAVPLAVEALSGGDPELHRWAAYALTREPLPEGLPHVRELLADPDPRVRAWAARAIGRIGDASDLPRLFLLLANDEAAPIIQALRAGRALSAGAAGAPAEWRGPIAKLVEDPRPGVRVTALEVAAQWLPDDALGRTLARVAGSGDASSWERGTALIALAAGSDPRAPGLTAELAGSDDEILRARAAEAAGVLEREDLLEILADDRSARVRQAVTAARLALAEADGGGDAERGPALARGALRDRDSGVRTTVLGWLAEHPVLPVAELAPIFDPDDERERTIEERLSAVDAIAALAAERAATSGSADPGTDPAVALLLSVTEGAELTVRRRVVEALAALGLPRPDPGHHATRLPPGVYASILDQTAAPRRVEMVTRRGAVTIRLDCPRAPLTCLNFLQLVRQGYFDGLTFHRVVPDFVVQGGDPRGDGWGGPGYTVRDEIGRLRYDRGVVGMALAGPDTGGSQFFVTLSPQPHLDGGYTAFGEVVEGMEVLDDIRQGDRIVSIREVS